MKKIKMTLYVIVVLWISVFTQLIVNHFFHDNSRIIDAFAGTNSEIVQSEIKVVANYGNKYLSEEDKKNLINYIATSIDLSTNYAFKTSNNKKVHEISVDKPAKNASTKIKVVSLNRENESGSKEMEQYIVVDLNVYENMKSVLTYKQLIEDKLRELKVKDYQTTILFRGSYDGKLSKDEKNQIADELIHNLEAKVISENRGNEMFTIYAYTGIIDEYITVSKSKVNVNLAFTYDEKKNQTELYLATPIIDTDY